MLLMCVRFGVHLSQLILCCFNIKLFIRLTSSAAFAFFQICLPRAFKLLQETTRQTTCCRSFWLDGRCLNALLLLQYSVALSILFHIILIKCAEQQSQSYQCQKTTLRGVQTSTVWFQKPRNAQSILKLRWARNKLSKIIPCLTEGAGEFVAAEGLQHTLCKRTLHSCSHERMPWAILTRSYEYLIILKHCFHLVTLIVFKQQHSSIADVVQYRDDVDITL